MNTKLLIAVTAALLFNSAAFAAQPNGRDSVYAATGQGSSTPTVSAAAQHSGRDSVYAFGKISSKPITVGQLNLKPGRA